MQKRRKMQNVIQGTTSNNQKIHEKQSAAAAASVCYESGKTSSTPQSSNSSTTKSETEISELQPLNYMEYLAIDQIELDEDDPESSKFLLISEDVKRFMDFESQDPWNSRKMYLQTLCALKALIGKFSLNDWNDLANHEVPRLTSSVSCGLNEAAVVLPHMRTRVHDNPRTRNKKHSLVEMCTAGNFRKLLTEGRSIHETTEEEESLLSLACSARSYELVQVLLAINANVENRGIKGDCTPLMEAASAGHVDIVSLLIAHGADVNAQSTSGNTPLMYGCAGGHEEVVRVLLKAGANVEDHNENGHTPLMEAASAGHCLVAKILLDHGAGINTHSNEFKESALTLACYKGHLEMVRFLLEAGADQEHKTDEMHTALMEASMDGHVEVARLLLDSGAQVNMSTDSFESPLTLAACGGHVNLAMLLIERGANIEEVNDEGCTPLMEAAREGHEEMVALLLSQGANINAQTAKTQETALTLACCGGFLEVADFLIKAGADIELGASTPLMEAAQEGHLDLVRYLLESAVDIHAQTQTGDTALTYACENGHTDVADLLLQFGADLEHESEGGITPLMKACRAGHLCTVQFLISKRADVNRQTTNNDHTPLSLACAGGHLAIVELLLAQSANPFHKLKDNSTMLIEAAKGGHTAVVQLLLDYPHSIMMSAPDSAASTSMILPQQQQHISHQQHVPQQTSTQSQHQQLQTIEQQTQNLQLKHNTQKSLLRKNRSVTMPDMSLTSAAQQVRSQSAGKPAAITKNDINILDNGSGGFTNLSESNSLSPTPTMSTQGINVTESQKYTREEQIFYKQQILEELQRVERELHIKGAGHLFSGLQSSIVNQSRQQNSSETEALLPGVLNIDSDPDVRKYKENACAFLTEAQKSKTFSTNERVLKFEDNPDLPLDDAFEIFRSLNFDDAVDTIEDQEKFELKRMDMSNNKEQQQQQQQHLQTQIVQQSGSSHVTQEYFTNPVLSVPSVSLSTLPSLQVTSAGVQIEADISAGLQLTTFPQTLPAVSGTTGIIDSIPPQSSSYAQSTTCITNQVQVATQTQAPATTTSSNIAAVDKRQMYTAPIIGKNKKTRYPLLSQQQQSCQQQQTASAQQTSNFPTQNYQLDPATVGGYTTNQVPPAPFSCMDVDSETDSNRDTALTLACAGGHEELVELLLLRKAAIEHRDKKGFTPLILAATAGHQKVVDILLNHGADIEAQSERTKDTPLSLACSGGRYEVVEHLLNRGANKEHRNVSDYTPLSLAASGGYVNIIKLLLASGAEINSRTGSKLGISPLMLAAMNGHTAAVKLLLDMGSDINAQIETNRNTALTLACFQGRHEVVSLLLDRKANVEHRAKTGLTPLMEAASGGYVEVGRVLLSKGADVNATPVPSSRDTALTIAADKGHCRFVELLLTRGTQVEVKNKKGNSPLWLAANGGHLSVVDLLHHAGADIDSQDNRKVSCLMAAFRKGHIKVVKWMMNHVTQFPSDQEITRYITTVSDKELLEKCQECMKVIRAAKETQAAKANKNATTLLKEVDMEKRRRIKKGSRCAKTGKKEKKRSSRRRRRN